MLTSKVPTLPEPKRLCGDLQQDRASQPAPEGFTPIMAQAPGIYKGPQGEPWTSFSPTLA